MPQRGTRRSLSSQVAAIMFATGRWNLPALAMVLILSLPLYVLGRDGTRAPRAIE